MIVPLLVVLTAGVAVAGAPQSVEIVVVGTPADLHRVRGLVDPERLGGAPPRWAHADTFDPTEVLRPGTALRCWVDLSHPQRSRARITFAARSGERFLVRDIELSGRFDELDRQSLAQVLELSVAALLEDERAGLSRAEAQALLAPEAPPPRPPPAPAPAPPPPPPVTTKATSSARRRWHPGLFYAARALGDRLPIGHGAGLSLEWRERRRPFGFLGWIEGQAHFPSQAGESTIGLRFVTLGARAGLGLAWSFNGDADPDDGDRSRHLRAQSLVTRLGLGMDFVHLSPRLGTGDASVMLASPRWSESLVVSAGLGLAFAFGTTTDMEIRLLADILPTAVHYDLASAAGQAQPVFSPWRVRPGALLALTF